jgi:hypothetical protein
VWRIFLARAFLFFRCVLVFLVRHCADELEERETQKNRTDEAQNFGTNERACALGCNYLVNAELRLRHESVCVQSVICH